MRYEMCKFGSEWPIVKDALFEEQSDFAVSRIPLEGFFMNIHTSKYPRAHYKQCKCRSHRLIIKTTLLRDECAFSDPYRP
jgi:hypothetical protein